MGGVFSAAAFIAAGQSAAFAADPQACKIVRMAEPGWNDLAFTTGIATTLLKALGYEPQSQLLGIDVIYTSLKTRDLDVFLGYWDPAMVNYYKPYKEDGSVEKVRTNLVGAKYTFAVPAYAWEAGVRDFTDLQKFADKFDRKLYGIEPGSNQLMLDAVNDPSLGLKDWEVVESSEQGMLSQVARFSRNKSFIVFQGWAPHPMNSKFDMKYLTGGDKFYGPNFGAATVDTQVRKGYTQECTNVAKLLQNLEFDVEYENKGMDLIMNGGLSPEDAAAQALKAEPQRLETWLKDVSTFDGQNGLAAVKAGLGL
ncbi:MULTISPECIES: choline ABC transporter substrate-binding protein [Agrobacterium]|uniref:choline ABC transporter substrate-binding protein n=1 Tax=Agrobacterium TaxID=357 RepID=UPI0022B815B8|nr:MULTISPECIES: choline ABC transporter substrate-binding protein [Agrobacterium]MCZ7885898.1 choline ABC transporter substrate-binding protein [Agrobacterium salinitolerans]MDA5627916.1 choline ABC transporter substrate-binding protein [Agrobacterium sp. ST15.16.055]MDA6978338.1 choline ABC transporter substrate-binding protein [Agrobacterium salinitolerans]